MDDIDCTKVLHALYEFLDGELTTERRQHIELHLNGCPHCFSAFDFEAELRLIVRSRLRVEVPLELRRRIVRALEAEGFHAPPGGGAPGLGTFPPLGPPGASGASPGPSRWPEPHGAFPVAAPVPTMRRPPGDVAAVTAPAGIQRLKRSVE